LIFIFYLNLFLYLFKQFLTSFQVSKNNENDISEWKPVQKGVKFDHNLDEIPLEIKSNTPKGTKDKYVWIQGTIATPVSSVDVFSLALVIEDNSAWLANCNGPGKTMFNPEPTTTEVVWTVFKTSKQLVMECNGEFCLKYMFYGNNHDIRCTTFYQPSIQMFFVDYNGQVAEKYRTSGTTCSLFALINFHIRLFSLF
jgi:hypothetical protein